LFGRPINEEVEEEYPVGDEFGMKEDREEDVPTEAIETGDPEASSPETEEAEVMVSPGNVSQAKNCRTKASELEESETDESAMLDLVAMGLIVEHVDLAGTSCFRRIGVFDSYPGSWFFGETHTVIALI
jgi:hypothetical protein